MSQNFIFQNYLFKVLQKYFVSFLFFANLKTSYTESIVEYQWQAYFHKIVIFKQYCWYKSKLKIEKDFNSQATNPINS